MQEGRPIRISTDRRGVTGGPVVQAAGPWRTSGEWWNDAAPVHLNASWDRDEWDVAIADGTSIASTSNAKSASGSSRALD